MYIEHDLRNLVADLLSTADEIWTAKLHAGKLIQSTALFVVYFYFDVDIR